MYPHSWWTPKEDRVLTEMWNSGATASSIGKKLQRTTGSVNWRVRALDLPRRRGSGERLAALRGSRDVPRVIQAVDMVRPRNGKYDSSRALQLLVDHWRKKAA